MAYDGIVGQDVIRPVTTSRQHADRAQWITTCSPARDCHAVDRSAVIRQISVIRVPFADRLIWFQTRGVR